MGVVSRGVQVALRIWQLICSLIVLGIIARFLDLVSDAGATRDGRIIYGIIVASISALFALVFVVPILYSFLAFPFDFALFVMWLVLFCLLMTVCILQRLHLAVVLTARPAHRYTHLHCALVLELLGVLLGRMVEESVPHRRPRRYPLHRMRPLANCSWVLVHGHVCLFDHHHSGKAITSFHDCNASLTYGNRVPTSCPGGGPREGRTVMGALQGE
jgi:hypothetical protein